MKIKYLIGILVLFVGFSAGEVSAQNVAVKTNVLYDATATINAGLEVGLSPRWTLDLSANYNGWTMSDNRKWKHWLVQPEARYWFCDRFAGNFVAAHVLGGEYNIGGVGTSFNFLGKVDPQFSRRRYQGWFAGAGVAYGHAWILGRHWNLEAELGLGYVYTRYDSYPCATCGKKLEEDKPRHYLGPTKAAISFVYLF